MCKILLRLSLIILAVFVCPYYAEASDNSVGINSARCDKSHFWATNPYRTSVATQKTFFYHKCAGSNNFCVSASYILGGDMIITEDWNSQYYCAAYGKGNSVNAFTIGLIKKSDTAKISSFSDQKDFLGLWQASNDTQIKHLMISASNRWYILDGSRTDKNSSQTDYSVHGNMVQMQDDYYLIGPRGADFSAYCKFYFKRYYNVLLVKDTQTCPVTTKSSMSGIYFPLSSVK